MGTISHRILGGGGGPHWNLHERYITPKPPNGTHCPSHAPAPDQGPTGVWEQTRGLCGADAWNPCPVGEGGTCWPLQSSSQHSSDASQTGHPARARQAPPAKGLAHLLRSTCAITFPLDPQSIPSRILPPPPDQFQSPSSLVLLPLFHWPHWKPGF